MHFIVETAEQLAQIPNSKECFINIIGGSDLMHPALNTPCAVYYRAQGKGFVFCINHGESFSIDFNLIKDFILSHEKIYCLNAKYHKYFLPTDLIDINFTLIDDNKPFLRNEDSYTPAHKFFYRTLPKTQSINRIIPLSKHYEMWEKIYNQISELLGKEQNLEFYTKYINLYKRIEENGIKVSKSILDHYDITPELSVRNGTIYTLYNLYNTTCRPTNSFNTINFLALNKESGCRASFIPKNDKFLELDFDAYHLRLIGNLIGYQFNSQSIHTELGKFYFKKDELSEEEYNESKKITFHNIYGGIKPEYVEIPFFKKMDEYIQSLPKDIITLPTGRKIVVDENMNAQKAFNYCIQNLETKMNVEILTELVNFTTSEISKIVLVVYDSFLVDFDVKTGEKLLNFIRDLIGKYGHVLKVKYGDNYGFSMKSQYL